MRPEQPTITEALDLAREVANPPQLWRSLEVMAEVETALGRRDAAADALREASALIEDVASSLKPERRDVFKSSPEISAALARSGGLRPTRVPKVAMIAFSGTRVAERPCKRSSRGVGLI